MKIAHYGLTLVESMAALSIVSISLLLALPGMQAFKEKSEQFAAREQLAHALALARSRAINTQQVITACPSDDGNQCSKQASNHLLVFNDSNNNRAADPGEILLQEKPSDYGRSITYSVSAGRPYIRFRPDGSAIEYGRIALCPNNTKTQTAQAFVLNYGGRLRRAEVTNKTCW